MNRVRQRAARSPGPYGTGAVGAKYAAGVLVALGVFLVVTGPSLALVSLLVSARVDQHASAMAANALATMHVAGLLTGLFGGILLPVGVVWWLYDAILARRSRQEPAA